MADPPVTTRLGDGSAVPSEFVSQLVFRLWGLLKFHRSPPAAPCAAFFRRFAAGEQVDYSSRGQMSPTLIPS